MTFYGGASGEGIIFSISTSGSGFTDLHDFSGSATDGAFPNGNLTLTGSTLYGMTDGGGANTDGIIFSINTNGTGFSDIHDFSNGAADGGYGGWGYFYYLTENSFTQSGNTLYGMTFLGGASGGGAIFLYSLLSSNATFFGTDF
jgi:uncharacterized repeat protein (TIGR03803 family)